MTIFDLVTSPAIAAYWDTFSQNLAPYLGEELFPSDKKLGLDLKWIKGKSGAPVVLKPSAYDSTAIPRPRIGFDQLAMQMPFFKESTFIDEELRQQLNMVLETNNPAYQDAILNRVFADQMSLLDGARAQRERMRMSLLTTGAISIAANGQTYTYDYGMDDTHTVEVTKSWSDPTADIVGDIIAWQDIIEDDTGVRPTRGVCDRKTWAYILANTAIKQSVFVLSNGGLALTDSELQNYLQNRLGIQVVVYNKSYVNEAGTTTRFIPADTFVLFPEGILGTTWFGTTPEESDLMTGGQFDVTITDTGVAVATTKKFDPVNVETKVSMISLPSFETVDQILIADVKAGA